MIRRKTSAIVESGILAAIAVIFTLIGNYIPVLDVIVSVWWPLPIILCGRRNGLMWSVLCLLVTGAVVAVLISPLQAVTQVLILGILGLVMGEGMRRQKSPASVLLWGSLGALLSVVLSGLAAYFLMGINVVESFTHAIAESVQMTKDIYDTLGVSGIMTTESLERMQHMLSLVLPAGLLLSCPISAFVNYWAARKVLSRLGDPYPWFPPFATWTLPRWILGGYGLGMATLLYFRGDETSYGFLGGYTLFTVASMLLLLQGLSVVLWYVQVRGKPRFWFPLAVLTSFVIPLVSQFLVVMGAIEMVTDQRKRRKR